MPAMALRWGSVPFAFNRMLAVLLVIWDYTYVKRRQVCNVVGPATLTKALTSEAWLGAVAGGHSAWNLHRLSLRLYWTFFPRPVSALQVIVVQLGPIEYKRINNFSSSYIWILKVWRDPMPPLQSERFVLPTCFLRLEANVTLSAEE